MALASEYRLRLLLAHAPFSSGRTAPSTVRLATPHVSRQTSLWCAGVICVAGCLLTWAISFFHLRELPFPGSRAVLVASIERGRRVLVSQPGATLIGLLGTYDDELYAFMMFEDLRSRPAIAGSELLLDYEEWSGRPRYRIHLICRNNLLSAIPRLTDLDTAGLAHSPSWAFVSGRSITAMRNETAVFVQTYTAPVSERFDRVAPVQRVQYVRRFLRFKSSTDPRVLARTGEISPLTRQQAGELAADIIAVADFYHLPLDFFLGIGAMENNYMSVRGDLHHAVWKRRAEKGDIVVRRHGGRVLVRNFSLGVWQITRETLRFAHSLYLGDSRDYAELPERLRPDRTLDIDKISAPVLTTYAGILLRYLLDRFHGDVRKAVGAYNGGVDHPNDAYAAGVGNVAAYARRILGRAAAMKDATVASLSDNGLRSPR